MADIPSIPPSSNEPTPNILVAQDVTICFGGLVAVDRVSFCLARGEITGLIGPNGAGKTTLFNAISGQLRPAAGTIRFFGKGGMIDLTRLRAHDATRVGIARTFQNIRIFKRMTVLENVLVGGHWRFTSTVIPIMFGSRGYRKEEKAQLEEAHNLLKLVHLDSYANEPAQNLPYGMQRRLEIARALAARPSLLMIDEPTAGMNEQETEELVEFILDTKERFNLTIFLIEHHMKFVMSLSSRILVLSSGKKIAEGSPVEVQHDPLVIEAYLGEET